MERLLNYPKTFEKIREFFFERMKRAIDTETLGEDYVNSLDVSVIEDDFVKVFAEANPNILVDFFDDNGIFIEIVVGRKLDEQPVFQYSFDGRVTSNDYSSRKGATADAVIVACKIMEETL